MLSCDFTLGLDSSELQLIDSFTDELKMKKGHSDFMSAVDIDEVQAKVKSHIASIPSRFRGITIKVVLYKMLYKT